MNTIPAHLIAIPGYDGYFYDREKEQLYSLKVTGTLKALTYQREKTVRGIGHFHAGFNVSRGGRKTVLSRAFLNKVSRQDYEVPFYEDRRCV